jgi:hypothetical protein
MAGQLASSPSSLYGLVDMGRLVFSSSLTRLIPFSRQDPDSNI